VTDTPSVKLLVCINRRFGADQASCAARGSESVADAIERGIAERGLDLPVERICCFGKCQDGPNMRLAPGGEFFMGVGLERVPDVLDALERTCGRTSANESVPLHLLGSRRDSNGHGCGPCV